jgi:hypothetical protein
MTYPGGVFGLLMRGLRRLPILAVESEDEFEARLGEDEFEARLGEVEFEARLGVCFFPAILRRRRRSDLFVAKSMSNGRQCVTRSSKAWTVCCSLRADRNINFCDLFSKIAAPGNMISYA